MDKNRLKQRKRRKKALGVRSRVRGDATKPRLTVFRSNRFIYAQAIDDVAGRTIASAGESEESLKADCAALAKCESAKLVGRRLAERLREQGVERVVFDRGWYRYHGRIKALADAARESGLKF